MENTNKIEYTMEAISSNQKLLTIVIAAYNMEKLLPRCLDSLNISPTLQQQVQVLVVNDGSKDRTLEIAKEYEAKFPGYIYAIDQTNGNYGKVMNHGLSLAEGKYFRTLDADDWYDTEAYAKFVEMLDDTDADMIITEKRTWNERWQTYIDDKLDVDPNKTGRDMPSAEAFALYDNIKLCLNVQHFTYKTEILRKSGLHWIERICYTDSLFDFWPLPWIETVRFEKLPVYIYLIGTNEQSVSPENVHKNFRHYYQVANVMVEYYEKHDNAHAAYHQVFTHFLWQIYNCLYRDLLCSSDNIQMIQQAHKRLSFVPQFQQEQIETHLFHGCHYLSKISEGKLPLKFKLMFYLAKFKHNFTRI